MTTDDCFQLGTITKTHGLQGDVVVYIDADDPEMYIDMESVFVEQNKNLVPYFIEYLSLKNKLATVGFEGVDSIEEAEALRNCNVYLPLTVLPQLEPDQFYYHDIIGFALIDEKLGNLGQVGTVYTMPAQDLISFTYQGKEVLVPVNDHVITRVDKAQQQLHLALPDGLLDVYLND